MDSALWPEARVGAFARAPATLGEKAAERQQQQESGFRAGDGGPQSPGPRTRPEAPPRASEWW